MLTAFGVDANLNLSKLKVFIPPIWKFELDTPPLSTSPYLWLIEFDTTSGAFYHPVLFTNAAGFMTLYFNFETNQSCNVIPELSPHHMSRTS